MSLLLSFIRMLERENLLTFDVLGDTEKHFENRIKIQKYVFLARYFGLDLGYDYSMYLYGPYSPDLAEKYYALAEKNSIETPLPEFNSKEFLELVRDKDVGWLELASTMLSLRESFTTRKSLLSRTENMKGDRFPIEKIESVLKELEDEGLISF